MPSVSDSEYVGGAQLVSCMASDHETNLSAKMAEDTVHGQIPVECEFGVSSALDIRKSHLGI